MVVDCLLGPRRCLPSRGCPRSCWLAAPSELPWLPASTQAPQLGPKATRAVGHAALQPESPLRPGQCRCCFCRRHSSGRLVLDMSQPTMVLLCANTQPSPRLLAFGRFRTCSAPLLRHCHAPQVGSKLSGVGTRQQDSPGNAAVQSDAWPLRPGQCRCRKGSASWLEATWCGEPAAGCHWQCSC